MSWIDKVESPFTIITADGLSYTVNWRNASKLVEYWISEFNFPNLAGSKVDRGKPRGARYDVEFYFQGENNIEDSLTFQKSADVTGPWTLVHPLYGQLVVQPVGMMYDNSQMNVTKVTGQVIETLTQDNPITTINPIDNIIIEKEKLDQSFVASITTIPTGNDVNTLQNNNNFLYKTTVPILKLPEDIQNYFNLFSIARANINNALASPQIAMSSVQAVINAPALLEINTKVRVQALNTQYNALRSQIKPKNTFQRVDKSTKQLYAVNGAAVISALCVAASTPLAGDYTNMTDVLEAIETILSNYNNYIGDLDSIQSATGAELDSYIPDYASLIGIRNLVSYVVSNLFTIALNASQERSIILEKDTNLILLTHRLYGLDEFDNNMDELMINNGWGITQLIQIKKNTKVVYYI